MSAPPTNNGSASLKSSSNSLETIFLLFVNRSNGASGISSGLRAEHPPLLSSRNSAFQLAIPQCAVMMAASQCSERLPLERAILINELSATSISSPSRGKLLQVLGMWFGIAAAVGNTIAAGIVATPGDIAKWLPNLWLFLGVWIVGGLYALFGASSMAELGASIPRSGGQYNFSRRAIGDYAGFIVGWSDWLSTCGTAAAVAIVTSEYTGHLFPILGGHVKLISV